MMITGSRGSLFALLDELRTFHAVARRRSFTRAAEEVALTQPAVSGHVRRLERHFGTRLCVVRHRRVFLTPEGEVLFAFAERVFNLLADAERAVEEVTALERGQLRLGASTTIGIYVLPPVLGDFARRYPRVRISLDIDTTAEIAARVQRGDLPLGLVEAEVEPDGLVAQPFLTDRLVLIVPPDHPWARQRRVGVAELASAALIQREPGSGTRALVERALRTHGLAPRVVMELGNTEAIKRAVMAGLGVAFVSRYTVAGELQTGQLAAVETPELALERTFRLLAPADGYRPRAVQAFLELLEHWSGAGVLPGLQPQQSLVEADLPHQGEAQRDAGQAGGQAQGQVHAVEPLGGEDQRQADRRAHGQHAAN
jgi:DNA-binding transcriptional LysR family regulator